MSNISAKVVAHSVSSVDGVELKTLELEMPKFILAEFNTHRMFSRSTASSRAIPVETMIELVQTNPAVPVFWGKAEKGMSATEEIDDVDEAVGVWRLAKRQAIALVNFLHSIGLHKQTANRLIEPFQMVKTVVTATEFENFFWLRHHPAAQPEMQDLAVQMYNALQVSKPVELKPGQWHTPYFENGYWTDSNSTSLEEARLISVSCCAQVSYRKNDTSLEKAKDLFNRLMGAVPKHASPTEHQATPIQNRPVLKDDGKCWYTFDTVETGVTHFKLDDQSLWSANLQGWIQYRQLIKDQNLIKEFKANV